MLMVRADVMTAFLRTMGAVMTAALNVALEPNVVERLPPVPRYHISLDTLNAVHSLP